MLWRSLLLSLLCCMLSPAIWAAPWDSDSITSIFSGRTLDPVEGVWQFPDDGARLLIVKNSASTYRLHMLESPSLDVCPGTIIGTLTITPTPGVFDTTLDPKPLSNKRLKKSNAAITLKDGSLRFKPYSTGKRLLFWRWIPYFFRIYVVDEHTRPDNLDGAQRIYPVNETDIPPCL